MKVSIGAHVQAGPWGGGNQFAVSLSQELSKRGIEVFHDLRQKDLDIILLVEPDRKLRISAFNHMDILHYLLRINPHAIVIHRINNSSEARTDSAGGYNRYRIQVNHMVADHTVFISKWLKECYHNSGFRSSDASVILNGADTQIWHPRSVSTQKHHLRIVTHHWSNHFNKGFDIYQRLDSLLSTKSWRDKIEFTYIGRLPDGFQFLNSQVVDYLSGSDLAEEICRHDIYLTAAMKEAAGMHHIEGALCGLPLLYRECGGIPEYCKGYGVSFHEGNFEQKLQEMVDDYDIWKVRMTDYPHNSRKMCDEYLELFHTLLDNRDFLISRRSKWYQWFCLVCSFLR